MTSILALAAVGPWTYAGFLAEPTPAPPVPPAVVVPAEPEGSKPAVVKPEPEAPRPSAQAIIPPTAGPPIRYRLADARGQHWEHPDPVYLRNFVYARNLSFVNQPVSPSRPGRLSRLGSVLRP